MPQQLQAKKKQEEHQIAVGNQPMETLRLNLSLALPHELRTPLSAILGFSEYLMSRDPDQLPEAEIILRIQSSIYDNALRLQRLIENYLLYTHLKLIENDYDCKRKEMWEGDELIDTNSLLTSLALAFAKKTHRQDDLHIDIVEADLRISARSLHKIMEELLDNAFKFSNPGTPIHISTEDCPSQWTLNISDQGRGMTTDQVENIGAFMQFDRLYYEQKGTGLGLTITYLLTHFNGGTLSIESIPQKGTTVTIVFPHKRVKSPIRSSKNLP